MVSEMSHGHDEEEKQQHPSENVCRATGDDGGSELKAWVRETICVDEVVIVTCNPWSKNKVKLMGTEAKGL